MINEKIKNIIYVLIASLYAFTLSLIPEFFLRDRDSYYVYAIESDRIFNNYLDENILKAITNEPLFLGLNYSLSTIIDPLYYASFLSFFISFVLIFFLMREVKGTLLKCMAILLVTFIPLLFHFQLVILRQSLATVIFIIVVMSTGKPRNWIIASFVLIFIHSSFAIVFILMCLLYIVKDYKYSLQIIAYIGCSILISSTIYILGNIVGARQTDTFDAAFAPSGLSFIMYLILLILLLSRGEKFLKDYRYSSIAILGLTCYLSLYFLSPMAGRLINIFFPFIICVLLRTTKLYSYLFIVIYFIVNLLTFKNAIILGSFTDEFKSFSNLFF